VALAYLIDAEVDEVNDADARVLKTLPPRSSK